LTAELSTKGTAALTKTGSDSGGNNQKQIGGGSVKYAVRLADRQTTHKDLHNTESFNLKTYQDINYQVPKVYVVRKQADTRLSQMLHSNQ
jgi:hypothetical protein